jgi:hypothetical protein
VSATTTITIEAFGPSPRVAVASQGPARSLRGRTRDRKCCEPSGRRRIRSAKAAAAGSLRNALRRRCGSPREGFKRLSARIRSTRDIVGQLDRDLHNPRVAESSDNSPMMWASSYRSPRRQSNGRSEAAIEAAADASQAAILKRSAHERRRIQTLTKRTHTPRTKRRPDSTGYWPPTECDRSVLRASSCDTYCARIRLPLISSLASRGAEAALQPVHPYILASRPPSRRTARFQDGNQGTRMERDDRTVARVAAGERSGLNGGVERWWHGRSHAVGVILSSCSGRSVRMLPCQTDSPIGD